MAEAGEAVWNEPARLAALQAYGILDTPREAAFDDIVRIAAQICQTPAAVVSLVDSSRQWFKAELGLGLREAPREGGMCTLALGQDRVFVVPDTLLDPRFAGHPFVVGAPYLRFYGGARLMTSDGLPLGMICVLDVVARPQGLTADQSFALEALARQVMARLELGRALALKEAAETALTAAHRRIEETLSSALVEKELMMQEVHHRVKNSLQMVQNLLMLQSRSSGDADTARQLREGAARVNIFASLHHQLYLSNDGGRVQVASYLEGVIHDLRTGIGSTLDGREIVLAAEAASWPAGEVPTLGLVVTELVTNALKYGQGTVRVTFRQAAGELAQLVVEDEGPGLPADFEPHRSRGLGMRLVTRLLAERGGGLVVDRGRAHSCLVVRLPRPRQG